MLRRLASQDCVVILLKVPKCLINKRLCCLLACLMLQSLKELNCHILGQLGAFALNHLLSVAKNWLAVALHRQRSFHLRFGRAYFLVLVWGWLTFRINWKLICSGALTSVDRLAQEWLHGRMLTRSALVTCRVLIRALDLLQALNRLLFVPDKAVIYQHVEGLVLIEVALLKRFVKFSLSTVGVESCKIFDSASELRITLFLGSHQEERRFCWGTGNHVCIIRTGWVLKELGWVVTVEVALALLLGVNVLDSDLH